MFELESWLDMNLSGRKGGGAEYSATCPFCGKSGKFSVNIEKKVFRCFSGSCQAAGRIPKLIAHVEGISIRDARQKAGEQSVFSKKEGFERKVATQRKLWDIPLPSEFIPCFQRSRDPQYRVVKYLKDRASNDILKKFGVGFCKVGKYHSRVVIPVKSEWGSAWTARDATGVLDKKRPKYLNPKGDWANDLLMGWDQYEPGADLCLVEGPFDVLRMYEHGIPSVGMLGKELGPGQRSQLLTLPSNTYITILVDPEEKRWTTDNIIAKLSLKFRNIFIGKLPMGVDPGSSTKKQAQLAIDTATRI